LSHVSLQMNALNVNVSPWGDRFDEKSVRPAQRRLLGLFHIANTFV
jgi:hypothetical protein